MGSQLSGAEPIAVVGMALRVPGAVSLHQFWQNLLSGTDSLTRPTIEDMRRAGLNRRQLADPRLIRSGPLLTDIDYFDAAFFDMPGFEAERTDPSHRLFLECVWEALESAGLAPRRMGAVTGVFGGAEGGYRKQQLVHLEEHTVEGGLHVPDRGKELPLHLGNSIDFFSTRVSHKLGFTGASFTVVAACATSLVAVHLALQSLRRRECEVAIVGGATALMPHVGAYVSSVEGLLSSSGRIRPFDAEADGTIFGSGIGAVVLRPLEDALADRNPIWAVVRGSGVSNDGDPPGKESFIAPSREGQIAAVEAAMSDAQVPAESIGYLEAHGTATLLGDPVEVASTAEVYRRETAAKAYCALGSVKGNVGHLRMAAGVVSFIKACLALKHRKLPPVANFAKHNPRIDFASSPFFVNTRPLEWTVGAHPRRAAVSSFGFGGANAHVIVDEYLSTPAPASSRRQHLLPLSAKTETALMRRMADLAAALDENPNLQVADVAHTLQCGRDAMPHRACICVDEETVKPSTLLRRGSNAKLTAKAENRPVVFLFPGQGAQRPGMGQDIYERERLYREIVDQCAALLEPELGLDIRALIHPQMGSVADAKNLRRTANAQPALFVVGYALASQFMSWGVKPEAMLGHSIGEIVAACIAGVFSLEDALTLVAARAKLMQACDPGAMAAVFLPEAQLREALAGHDLEIAALNAPNISVVSGPEPAITRFIEEMKKADVGTRRVETSHAFHSRMMDPALPAFREILEGIELRAPNLPVISNTTGCVLTEEQARDPEYWSSHLRHTVRFSSGAEHLLKNDDRVFLELGPGRTLCELVRQHNPNADVFAALERDRAESPEQTEHSALFALGQLWCAGGSVDWQKLDSERPRDKVALPTYPFERKRYWIESGDFESKPKEGLFLYEPGWRLAALEHDQPAGDGRAWLIFEDEHGLGRAIRERLNAQGQPVISLTPGDAFIETGPDAFIVRPGCKEDFATALEKARARDSGLAPRVLHLWSVTGRSGEHNTIDAFRRSNRTGFYTLIALTQAACDVRISDVDVLVVADGLRQIDGEDSPLHAEKGSLLGPIRNIVNEFPLMSFRYVDISGFEDRQNKDDLCSAIIAEALGQDQQHAICLRAVGRYVEELYPYSVPPLGRPRLRDGGTVLITGGVGGLGLEVAHTLFDAAKTRLILTSRWTPPPREEWRERAAKGDKIANALREVIALEERGAQLLIVQADAGDIDSLKAAIAEAETHFGAINGVVHAAGINTDGPALNSTPEIAEPAFEAKVHGAFNLEEVFADAPLDFFVYFSSQASYNPAPGQTIYTAANSVLDILSRRRSLTQPGLNCAIGWAAWQEIGMAAVRAEKRIREPKGHASHESNESIGTVDHPLIRSRHRGGNGSTIYRSVLRDREHWVCEHRYKGRALLAGATILECLRASYVDLLGGEVAVEFSQMAFLRPLFVDQGVEIEIVYSPKGDRQRVEVRSRPLGTNDDWTINTVGFAMPHRSRSAQPLAIPGDVPHETLVHVAAPGFTVGKRWDCVVGAKLDGDTMWARVRLPEDFRADLNSFGLHSATFDRALNDPSKMYGTMGVPYTLDRIRIFDRLGAEFLVRSMRRHTVNSVDAIDAQFVDCDGNILVETEGFVARDVKGSSLEELPSAASYLLVPGAGLAKTQRMAVTQPGRLDSLQPREFELRAPRAGEVQIDVIAAGLNFRDVLSALGQLSLVGGSDPRIGGECSGIVSAVGDGVTDIRPGDPVVALARDSFAGSVIVPSDLVMPVPHNICMEDAAGIPIAFLTADYAINKLAGLKKGERILIHAAAGGVGLAAVQIAQSVGAEILATAGHPDKRQYLKSLGVEHIMDSRSLDFVQETSEITNGEGVDVVLNSLAGEYIPAGLSLLRYRGRFLEIGKRDILSNAQIGLAPFQNNLAYHAIDLGPMIERRDPLLLGLFDSLMLRFARGDLRPIPTAVIPIADMAQAMQRMARAEHIGKIVLKVQDDPDAWRSIFKKFQELYGRGVPVAEGLDTFRRLLSTNALPHYVMALGQKIDEVGKVESRIGGKRSTRPHLSNEFKAPTTAEEKRLVQIWENAIGVSPIGVHDDFFDLGGDSIVAIQTQFSVADEFGINLSTGAFFDYPTIASLAEQICKLKSSVRGQDDHEPLGEQSQSEELRLATHTQLPQPVASGR